MKPIRSFPTISICVPVFNEEDNVAALINRLLVVLGKMNQGENKRPHQLIFADDGSSDGTTKRLSEFFPIIKQSGFNARIVRLSRNFGHQTALTAALDHANGDVCFLIDGDLQDSPEELPRFVNEYCDGADVVYARRIKRKESLLLRIAYAAFYRVARSLSEHPLPLDAGDFSLISKRVVDVMRGSPERNRYLRGLRSWAGFHQVAIPVERAARHAGESKYSVLRLFKLACDGIFSFSVVPLRISAFIGAITLGISAVFGGYALYVRFFEDRSPPGFTALTFLLIAFSGIQLLSMGIIGEYIGRIYQETKRRPLYVVQEVIES